MAEAWIKMRVELPTSPKVVRMASALNADRFRIVGGLHSAWSLFDKHSEDGILKGYSFAWMDDLIGWPGFCQAMSSVEWLAETPQGLEMPRFDTHNGQSAKRRAQESDRKRRGRTDGQTSASDADKKRTRKEKKRKEKNTEISTDVDISLGASHPYPHLPSLKEIDFSAWPSLPTESTMGQWLKVRRDKKAATTQIAMDKARRQVEVAAEFGVTAEDLIALAVEQSWQGIQWDWVINKFGIRGDLCFETVAGPARRIAEALRKTDMSVQKQLAREDAA